MKRLMALIMVLGFSCMIASISCAEGTAQPVYRFYNTITGAHFFTIDENEKDYIIANYSHFRFEGIAFCAFPGPCGDGDTRWGALNGLGCEDDSSLTFSVKINETTKSSTTYGLESTPSWEGYASTSSGTKNFQWSLSGCASGQGSITTPYLETDKCYVFLLGLNDDNTDFAIKLIEMSSCGNPISSSSSFEENGDAMDLEKLEGITLQNADEFDFIEKYEFDFIE